MRVARRHSAGASAKAAAIHAAGIAIDGYGRIGCQVARVATKDPEVELKLTNASYDAEYLAYQLKYNSIHGHRDGAIEVDGDSLVNNSQTVSLSHTRDPAELPFAEHGAEYVSESAGMFPHDQTVQPHLTAGAKQVVFSAPATDRSHTIVMGANQETYDLSFLAAIDRKPNVSGFIIEDLGVQLAQHGGHSGPLAASMPTCQTSTLRRHANNTRDCLPRAHDGAA